MKKKILLAGAAVLVLLAGVVIIRRPWRPPFERLRQARPYNVLLITLDTARADRIRTYGCEAVETPVIDSLAAQGIRFDRCMSQTPLTLPSHVTIMSGTYPPFHGVRDNGGFIVPPSLETLAKTFKAQGYKTGAFVGAYVLDSKWGLNQGFDTYFDKFDLSRFEKISLGTVQRPANEVVDEALPWLEKNQDDPFFAWVHIYDPHTPYAPPPPYDRIYQKAPYLGEIAFSDSQIGRLWDFLVRKGLRENTFVVFVSDHGESLGAHEESSHGFFVYQEALHVPFIVVTPFSKLQGIVSNRVVTLADVMPTIQEMAGLPISSQVQGQSLVPLFFRPDRDPQGGGSAYSETYYPRFHYGWSELKSYQNRRFKLIIAPDLELYDLQADPREKINLAASDPGTTRDLLQQAESFMERTGRNALLSDLSKVDEETRQRLAALGYVGTFTDPSKLEGRKLASPREKIGVFNDISRAREMGMESRAEEALGILRRIIASDPEVVDAHFAMGNILFKERRFPEAIAAFKTALDKKPDDAFTVINIANSYMGQGKPKEAEAFLLSQIEKGFKDPQFYHLLGTMAYIQNRNDDAIAYFSKCLTLNAESASSHNSLAAIYILKDDPVRAEEHIRKALELNAGLRMVHFNLAQLHEKKGELGKAAEAYLKELELSPLNFRASFNLSRVYRQLGRPEEELAYLKKTIELGPEFPLAYFYLARIYLNQGQDLEMAVGLVKKGIELKPEASDLPLGYFLLADLYNRLGRNDLSREYAGKGQELVRAARSAGR